MYITNEGNKIQPSNKGDLNIHRLFILYMDGNIKKSVSLCTSENLLF